MKRYRITFQMTTKQIVVSAKNKREAVKEGRKRLNNFKNTNLIDKTYTDEIQ